MQGVKPQDKSRRQQKILSLIRVKEIRTQTELVRELERAGLEVNQSSVSRDLVELGIVKNRGVYVVPGSADPTQTQRLRGLRVAGDSLIVLKCDSGFASALTVEIDKAHIPEIIGTIAGDDTIFVAVNGRKNQDTCVRALNNLFERKAEEES
jgi:transcriptional regulator of arginine metabolism